MTEAPSFLLPRKLFWLSVLSSNFGFLTSMRLVSFYLFNFLDINFFKIFFPFRILSYYPNIDSSYELREDVKRMNNFFKEEKIVD